MNQNNKMIKFSKSIFSVAQKHKAETEISELLDILILFQIFSKIQAIFNN